MRHNQQPRGPLTRTSASALHALHYPPATPKARIPHTSHFSLQIFALQHSNPTSKNETRAPSVSIPPGSNHAVCLLPSSFSPPPPPHPHLHLHTNPAPPPPPHRLPLPHRRPHPPLFLPPLQHPQALVPPRRRHRFHPKTPQGLLAAGPRPRNLRRAHRRCRSRPQ